MLRHALRRAARPMSASSELLQRAMCFSLSNKDLADVVDLVRVASGKQEQPSTELAPEPFEVETTVNVPVLSEAGADATTAAVCDLDVAAALYEEAERLGVDGAPIDGMDDEQRPAFILQARVNRAAVDHERGDMDEAIRRYEAILASPCVLLDGHASTRVERQPPSLRVSSRSGRDTQRPRHASRLVRTQRNTTHHRPTPRTTRSA